ncbi:hypothetical protein [Komagataeibacter swingsii]|uniref:Uncharacterized protein n=1 Tax=Komagataeibacter swingsii TaxID=215220 RepID=A0A850P2J1_9PROT|nr:hypothetical protein [Komagataeibacter swingsii]NVN36870.1 hypothetical protein [Komagataeibacter swingsii]
MKLFASSSKERRLFEKGRYPETFIFLSTSYFQTVSKCLTENELSDFSRL